ncbi:MAG TPA: FKBP-type peptidyl-prolyl cis-trans isomerase [Vicinamibacterales bacterium]|nr:FKBP-type peptidyl-prolyl cis-trans isomerase [Vicinamibacterales bacterium]
MRRFFVLTALLAVTACGSDSSSNSLAPTSVGIYTVTDLVVGAGTTAVSGNHVTVGYTGWLYDTSKTDGKGNQFQSNPSFGFTLGANTVIKGWDTGIPGMKIGGRRRLILPPDYAYGSSTPDPATIPPNATLLFEVTLNSIP